MKLRLSKTSPEQFCRFLEGVERFQPTTVSTLCADLGEVTGRVQATKVFAETYGFVKSKGIRDIALTELGSRLLRYSGNARTDFLIHNARIQDKNPFVFLAEELGKSSSLTLKRITSLLQTKYDAPKSSIANQYAKGYADWLVELRIAKWNGNVLEYAGGKVRSLDIIALDDANKLLDASLYDLLTETFTQYQDILQEPMGLLVKIASTTDGKIKGDLFEKFVASVFKKMGFSTRLRDGIREAKRNLTFERPGGGDVALFCHFPIVAGGKVRPGFAIACEAKATEEAVGSTAVGQVRNLAEKIVESFPDYLVQSLVISRSKVGYDSSGREQSPPEVVHLTSDLLIEALKMQASRARKSLRLITPLDLMLAIDDQVQSQNLQPDWMVFSKTLSKHLFAS
jgi:hypothetical protein